MRKTDLPDLEGCVFGELTVLWKHKRSNNGGASWVCRCSCGHLDIISGNRLMSGHKTRCSYCNMGRYSFHDDYLTTQCVLPNGDSFFIDTADFPLVSRYKWSRMKNGYFKASLGSREKGHVLLHRLLMNPPDDMVVDHINGDKSNCKRSNLRICTQAENSRNASLNKNNICGYKGVYFDPRRKRWYSRIHMGRTHSLGGFETAEDAALAYDVAAEALHGDFAKGNKTIGLI